MNRRAVCNAVTSITCHVAAGCVRRQMNCGRAALQLTARIARH